MGAKKPHAAPQPAPMPPPGVSSVPPPYLSPMPPDMGAHAHLASMYAAAPPGAYPPYPPGVSAVPPPYLSPMPAHHHHLHHHHHVHPAVRPHAAGGPPPPPLPAALLRHSGPVPVAADSAEPGFQIPADAAGPCDRTTSSQPTATDGAASQSKLDLVFCCDCTGSMGAYLRSAQDNIRAIAQTIHDRKHGACSIRYALVKYRDHPPQDSTFVTEVFPFTTSLEVMKANVDTMTASGGGDGPEAVTAALSEVLELGWRDDATKVCVLISDAPPHGLGERGDGFPDGDPQGRDPIEITRQLAQRGVTVYAIGVEPVLSTTYKFARDFMMMVASLTAGKFLPLGKAGILSQVIVSTSIEGLELEQLWNDVEAEVLREASARGEAPPDAAELAARVEAAMSAKQHDVVVEQVEVANPYLDARYDHANHHALSAATSLRAARAHLREDRNAHVAEESGGYAWGAQAAQCQQAPCTASQMSRAAQHAKAKRGVW